MLWLYAVLSGARPFFSPILIKKKYVDITLCARKLKLFNYFELALLNATFMKDRICTNNHVSVYEILMRVYIWLVLFMQWKFTSTPSSLLSWRILLSANVIKENLSHANSINNNSKFQITPMINYSIMINLRTSLAASLICWHCEIKQEKGR